MLPEVRGCNDFGAHSNAFCGVMPAHEQVDVVAGSSGCAHALVEKLQSCSHVCVESIASPQLKVLFIQAAGRSAGGKGSEKPKQTNLSKKIKNIKKKTKPMLRNIGGRRPNVV